MTAGRDELQRNVEASRTLLGSTLGKLQRRLNVPYIIEDALDNVRQSDIGSRFYDSALDAIRRNPVPVLLACASALVLLRRGRKPENRGRQ